MVVIGCDQHIANPADGCVDWWLDNLQCAGSYLPTKLEKIVLQRLEMSG